MQLTIYIFCIVNFFLSFFCLELTVQSKYHFMGVKFRCDNILIVDDYRTMLKIMGSLLRHLGFKNIDEATDGEMAFEMMLQKKYSLVISDWNMEPLSGLELLKKIRNYDDFKNIPFIMVTAENKIENVIAAKQSGTSDYILKPFTGNVLKEKIASCFGDF
jgi:two-component system chemotaxis response regulator CheY